MMFWIFAGFLTGLGIETFIRVAHNYESEPKRQTPKVQVSLPWYGWGLAGLATLGIWRKGKRR